MSEMDDMSAIAAPGRNMRRNFVSPAALAPLFRPPSHAEVAETVVSEVLGGRAIVAVRGDAGVGKTALVGRAAAKLTSHRRTLATIDAESAHPATLLQRVGQALHIDDAGLLEPDALLGRLRTWEGAERIVLLIDDADRLSSTMFRTLALLLKLFDLRPATLQIVLVGRSGQWPGVQPPDLETMRRATLSLHTIAASPLDDETGGPDRSSGLSRRSGPLAADGLRQAASRRSRNRIAVAALGLLMTGIATAELIERSDAVAPSPGAKQAADIQPSVPAAVNVGETAARAVPRTPDLDTAKPLPKLTPPADPAPSGTQLVQATPPAPGVAQAASTLPMTDSRGGPGLVLVAGAGDNLPALYAKVYRGVTPPPYTQVVAVNRMPMKPGALVVFPEPPAGWPLR